MKLLSRAYISLRYVKVFTFYAEKTSINCRCKSFKLITAAPRKGRAPLASLEAFARKKSSLHSNHAQLRHEKLSQFIKKIVKESVCGTLPYSHNARENLSCFTRPLTISSDVPIEIYNIRKKLETVVVLSSVLFIAKCRIRTDLDRRRSIDRTKAEMCANF